jgi:hypothetical protein
MNINTLLATAHLEKELDNLATRITLAIYSVYEASARKTRPQGGGQPWWNPDCKEALLKYRAGLYSQKDLRQVVRQA